jgi:hypothetical protein
MIKSDKPVLTGLTQGKTATQHQVLSSQLTDLLLAWLKPKFNSVFDKVDDSLFDQAERSGNNQYQQQFFETMRMLRVERENISLSFYKHIRQGWRQVKSPEDLAKTVDIDTLSIMHKDELEEQVANDTMIERATNNTGNALEFLIKRCQVLMPNIHKNDLPHHPKYICKSFHHALENIEIDISCKLIILKLFDRHLLSLLSECYQEANQAFIAANILPDLTQNAAHKNSNNTPQNSNESTTSADINAPQDFSALRGMLGNGQTPNANTGFSSGEFNTQDFNALRGLINQTPNTAANLSTQNNSPMNGASLQTGNQTSANSTANMVSGSASHTHVAQVPELISILNQFQSSTQGQTDNAIIPLTQIQGVIENKLDAKSVNPVDSDAINLVAMLFEFILGDPQLSVHMKELLGRLQIPMLKVAVLDHDFFSDALHPARRLLNGLARAGQAWDPQENLEEDKYYQIVSKIILRVSHEFKEDMSLFSDLNEKLEKLLASQKRRQGASEHKLKIAEEAQAKLQIANIQAMETIQDICEQSVTPKFVHHFLNEQWSRVLSKALLLENEAKIQQCSQVIKDILWSIEPQQMTQNRPEFLKVVPKLLKTIRAVGVDMKFEEDAMKVFFDNLQRIHLGEVSLSNYKEGSEDVDLSEFEDLGQNEGGPTELDLSEFEDLGLHKANARSKALSNDHDKQSDQGDDALPDNVITFKSQSTDSEEPAPIQSCDPIFYEKVSGFSMGARFDLNNGTETIRCNLAVIIKSIGKYVFVNRHGIKVDEKNTEQMAMSLQDGSLKHLDDSQLFDRALEAVIGSLRQHQA